MNSSCNGGKPSPFTKLSTRSTKSRVALQVHGTPSGKSDALALDSSWEDAKAWRAFADGKRISQAFRIRESMAAHGTDVKFLSEARFHATNAYVGSAATRASGTTERLVAAVDAE